MNASSPRFCQWYLRNVLPGIGWTTASDYKQADTTYHKETPYSGIYNMNGGIALRASIPDGCRSIQVTLA